MKIVWARILSIALVVGMVPVAFAKTKKAPQPPPGPPLMQSLEPSPYLGRLDWMAGTWQCEGKQFSSVLGPAHEFRATLQIERQVEGWWWSTHLQEKKSEYTFPIEEQGYIGFDRAAEHFVNLEVMAGGAHAQSSSKGFEGDRLIFTGDAYLEGKRVGYRDSLTKHSIDSISMSTETGGPEANQGWAQFRQASCKRAVAEAQRKKGT